MILSNTKRGEELIGTTARAVEDVAVEEHILKHLKL